jgi:hypothetical protein
VNGHPIPWLVAALASIGAAVIAALAVRVRLLPEVIDISIVLTFAGVGALVFTTYGALRRFDPDRIARLSLGGTVLGSLVGVVVFLGALLLQVI